MGLKHPWVWHLQRFLEPFLLCGYWGTIFLRFALLTTILEHLKFKKKIINWTSFPSHDFQLAPLVKLKMTRAGS